MRLVFLSAGTSGHLENDLIISSVIGAILCHGSIVDSARVHSNAAQLLVLVCGVSVVMMLLSWIGNKNIGNSNIISYISYSLRVSYHI